MKRIIFMMLLAIPGLAFLGCEEMSNPTASSLSNEGTSSLPKPPGTFSETRTFDINAQSQSPCEAQTIDIGGQLAAKFTYQLVGSNYQLTLQPKPQDLAAVGLSTGVTYKGTGVSPFQFSGQVAVPQSFQTSIPMKSQGPSPNILVLVAWNTTIAPNGALTVTPSVLSIQCQ